MHPLLRTGVLGLAVMALVAPTASVSVAAAEVAMRSMTPAEEAANRIWTLRAALNVAALQCQFSPALRTVGQYNDMLRHHSIELGAAFKTLGAHFMRHDGKRGGQSGLDRYTTRVYNGFSTLDAQRTFCAATSRAGADVLQIRQGTLAGFAAARLPEIRASLVATVNPQARVDMGWVIVPPIPNPCLDAKGKRIKRC